MSTRPPEPPNEQPSPLLLLMMGIAGGLAVGWTFLFWEALLGYWMGLVLPTGDQRDTVMWLYLAMSGLAGTLFGALGLRRGEWAISMAALGAGYLLSGKLGMALADIGFPVEFGVVLIAVGLVSGLAAARSRLKDNILLAIAVGTFVVLAIGLPVNLHLLPGPFASVSLGVDFGVLLLGGIVGGGYWLWLTRVTRRSGILLPIVAANLVALTAVVFAPDRDVPRAVGSDSEGAPVVLVVVDTLRADHVGAYGYERDVTPNIDQLARQGAVFQHVWTHAPWTLPAMGSLMTGRYPTNHGAGVNNGTGNERTSLRRDTTTLATELAEDGYETVGITTNPWVSATFGFDRGFSIYDDQIGPFALPVALHPMRVFGWEPLESVHYRTAAQITDAALTQLDGMGDSGWFLYVHYMDVHGPHVVPDADHDALDLPDEPTYTDTYDASLYRTDRHIGRLLDHVPSNAWIIVTSDHGEQLTEERVAPERSPAGVRHGHTLYNELLRVPLIVKGPGVAPRRVQRLVGLVDLLPSLTAALDLELEEATDGFIWPEVEPGAQVPADRILLAEGMRWGDEQKAARRGAYKLITNGEDFELYDLQASPGEQVQVGMAQRGSTSILRELREAIPPTGAEPAGDAAELGGELRSLLERLGYADP